MVHGDDPNADQIDETPDEEIIAGFRQSWHEAMTGDTRPIAELLNGLEDNDSAPNGVRLE